jgi:hypothetical protein
MSHSPAAPIAAVVHHVEAWRQEGRAGAGLHGESRRARPAEGQRVAGLCLKSPKKKEKYKVKMHLLR